MTSGQDQESKFAAVKAAQKFFGEDKDRGFEAKVSCSRFPYLGPRDKSKLPSFR